MLQRITKAALISIVLAAGLAMVGLVGGVERDQLSFAGFGIGIAICAVTICGCCLLYWVFFEQKNALRSRELHKGTNKKLTAISISDKIGDVNRGREDEN